MSEGFFDILTATTVWLGSDTSFTPPPDVFLPKVLVSGRRRFRLPSRGKFVYINGSRFTGPHLFTPKVSTNPQPIPSRFFDRKNGFMFVAAHRALLDSGAIIHLDFTSVIYGTKITGLNQAVSYQRFNPSVLRFSFGILSVNTAPRIQPPTIRIPHRQRERKNGMMWTRA
jgi:hypothetical protein